MATRTQIRIALENPDWVQFRELLKGKSTKDKLDLLHEHMYDWQYFGHSYLDGQEAWSQHVHDKTTGPKPCMLCIRVDQYLKGLVRGGQLKTGTTLQYMVDHNWEYESRILQ
jgi:hypothetical protein